MTIIRTCFSTALLALTAVGCRGERHRSEARGEVVGTCASAPGPTCGIAPSELRREIDVRLEAARPPGTTETEWRTVRALYDRAERRPLWFSATDTSRARSVVRAIAGAPTHALTVDTTLIDSLRGAMRDVRNAAPATPASAEQVARADVLLSSAFVSLAKDLLVGQLDPRTVTKGWYIDRRGTDVDSIITEQAFGGSIDSAVRQLAPNDPVYDALRVQLARYRDIAARGGWSPVPSGPTLRDESRSDLKRLHLLARRLWQEGYMPDTGIVSDAAGSDTSVYDVRFATAVAAFQDHHSIEVDSNLGPGTVAALNVPASYRAEQLAANLERIRWLPRTIHDRHLIVNVPSFRLLVREGPNPLLTMRVVVGSEFRDRSTPVFADSMSYVVFQPYWNVTPSIAMKEIIPKVARDPGYLARNDYEVVQGNGDDAQVVSAAYLTPANVRAGRVRVRQRPGDHNALGHAKFIFPNDFNIYLHDTPERELFDRDVRAYSHGCIRVQRPLALASLVLGWDSTRVAAAMSGPKRNQYVPLARKLPVYIIYLTAFVRDGELYFGNDLYSRDDALVQRMASAAFPDARTVAALDELNRLAAGR